MNAVIAVLDAVHSFENDSGNAVGSVAIAIVVVFVMVVTTATGRCDSLTRRAPGRRSLPARRRPLFIRVLFVVRRLVVLVCTVSSC